MDWTWLGVVCLVCLLAAYWFKPRKQEEAPAKANVGDITEETLAYYSGYDYMKPILVAIKGRVFDVTKAADQFGPGGACTLWQTRDLREEQGYTGRGRAPDRWGGCACRCTAYTAAGTPTSGTVGPGSIPAC